MRTRPAYFENTDRGETLDKRGLWVDGPEKSGLGWGFSSLFFSNGGCIFTKHTSLMLKNTINNVIASVSAIIIVVVIIITSAGGGG